LKEEQIQQREAAAAEREVQISMKNRKNHQKSPK
jgi:hypothetical protein